MSDFTCPGCGAVNDIHFDRSLCACGDMHNFCGCGRQVDGCEYSSPCACYPANETCPSECRCSHTAAHNAPAHNGGQGDPVYLQILDEIRELHLLKSSTYGTGADPLANFTAVAGATGEPPWTYPRRRAIEKLARLESLEAQGRVDEMGEDHVDIASLLLCAEALRRRG